MILDKYEFSSRGSRYCNEDAVGSRVEGDSGIFVAADGLGGHSFGEAASACVRDTLLEGFPCQEENTAWWLERQFAEANRRVCALQEEKGKILKSTAVVLSIIGNEAVWAHVGDSRLYYIHNGRLAAYTEDHSVAYKKYKAGAISRQEIAFDEDQTALLRSIGGKDHNEPAIRAYEKPLCPGDAFFLCTDGAWEFLDDAEIVIDLLKSENARQWVEFLLLRLMERIKGGNDNLTMLAVMLKEPETADCRLR